VIMDHSLWFLFLGGRTSGTVRILAGVVMLGVDRERLSFGWDNEFDVHCIEVLAFDIDVHSVMNVQFMEFVEVGGY